MPVRRPSRPASGGNSSWRTRNERGVAGPSGFACDVGVVGFTLAGGMGWLSRTYGLAADNVVVAHVVLAKGAVVLASDPEHAHLLWASRGGGGSFGIVTSQTLRRAPLSEAYGGALHYAYADAASLLRRFAASTRDISETMTGAPRNVGVLSDNSDSSGVTIRRCRL